MLPSSTPPLPLDGRASCKPPNRRDPLRSYSLFFGGSRPGTQNPHPPTTHPGLLLLGARAWAPSPSPEDGMKECKPATAMPNGPGYLGQYYSLLPGMVGWGFGQNAKPGLPHRNLCLSSPQGPPISPRLILNPSSKGSFLARPPQRPPQITSSQHKVSCLGQGWAKSRERSLLPSSDPCFQPSLWAR